MDHLGTADGALIIGKFGHLEHIEHFAAASSWPRDVEPSHRHSQAQEAHKVLHLSGCFLLTDVLCFVSMSRNMICVKTTPGPDRGCQHKTHAKKILFTKFYLAF